MSRDLDALCNRAANPPIAEPGRPIFVERFQPVFLGSGGVCPIEYTNEHESVPPAQSQHKRMRRAKRKIRK